MNDILNHKVHPRDTPPLHCWHTDALSRPQSKTTASPVKQSLTAVVLHLLFQLREYCLRLRNMVASNSTEAELSNAMDTMIEEVRFWHAHSFSCKMSMKWCCYHWICFMVLVCIGQCKLLYWDKAREMKNQSTIVAMMKSSVRFESSLQWSLVSPQEGAATHQIFFLNVNLSTDAQVLFCLAFGLTYNGEWCWSMLQRWARKIGWKGGYARVIGNQGKTVPTNGLQYFWLL